jgi:hypothetical protein
VVGLAAGACAPFGREAPGESTRWWRGNVHTHSLWSDGEDFPEMIAEWYRERGYHFVVFTEHDRLQEGEFWVDIAAEDPGWPPRNASTGAALDGYRERFGPDWVVERRDGVRHLVRLRPMSEYRHLFEEPGRFLLLMGEEITDLEGAHVNAVGPRTEILPAGGTGPADRVRNKLAAVAEQRASSGRPIPAVINHRRDPGRGRWPGRRVRVPWRRALCPRARLSSRPHTDPTTGGVLGPAEAALTQPVFRRR